MIILRLNNQSHTVFHLNKHEAEKVDQAIKLKKTFVKVRGILVNVKTEIEAFGEEKPDILEPNTSGIRCVGQYSIQNEINHIAKSSGVNWLKLMTNTTWRKKTYDQLYEQSSQWCDVAKHTCYCEPEFLNNPFQKQ